MTAAEVKADTTLLEAGPQRLIARTAEVVEAADRILALAKDGVLTKVAEAGGVAAAQQAPHGLAWLATTVEARRQMNLWAARLQEEGSFGEFEQRILLAAFGEYGAQVAGGIPMSQLEIIRPEALGVPKAEIRKCE